MTKRIVFTVRAWSQAAPEAVYRLLADGASWPRWSPLGSYRLEKEGPAGGETVGAIRVFTTSGLRNREEILELRPDERLSYSSLSGMPIREHRADVELTGRDGGTAISWREDFVPRRPASGPLLRWFLQRFAQRCADGLAVGAAVPAGPVKPDRPAGPAKPKGPAGPGG